MPTNSVLCRDFLRLAARRARVADETRNRDLSREMRQIIRQYWSRRNTVIKIGRV